MQRSEPVTLGKDGLTVKVKPFEVKHENPANIRYTVEAVLLEHEAVREVAVVGSPDPDRGQIVKAFVELRDKSAANDALVGDMQDFVKSQISAFKYPRAIEFVDELPHTPTGKIQRGALRQLERDRAGG